MPRRDRIDDDYNDRLDEALEDDLEDQLVDSTTGASAMDALHRIGDLEREHSDRDGVKLRFWRNASRLEVWDEGSSAEVESFRLNNEDLNFLVELGYIEFVELPDGRDPEEVRVTPEGWRAYDEG